MLLCVRSQCYLFIRILKRLSRLIHGLTDKPPEHYDTDVARLNIVRCLELIEAVSIYVSLSFFSFIVFFFVYALVLI